MASIEPLERSYGSIWVAWNQQHRAQMATGARGFAGLVAPVLAICRRSAAIASHEAE